MQRVRKIILGLLLLFPLPDLLAWEKNPNTQGENLFQTNCSPCHAVGKELTGPALVNITKKRPREWLFKFIQNSQNIILEGDPYAVNLYEHYNHAVMPPFAKVLTRNQIHEILNYLEQESYLPQEKFTEKRTSIRGQKLFDNHCQKCHALDQEQYGPGLASVAKRRPREWLYGFIKNSQKVIKSGDPYAIYVYHSFNKKVMPSFEFLSNEEISELLNYIGKASTSPNHIAGVNSQFDGDSSSVFPEIPVADQPRVDAPYAQGGLFFKFLLGFATLLAASVHIYTMYRIFIYLLRR